MKALSIRQPWAWLIVHGHKDIENRSWYTHFRGKLLVHAAKGMTFNEYEHARFHAELEGIKIPAMADLERGGIVGEVEITDCVEEAATDSPWFFGPWGFQLANAKPHTFQPCKGKLGFFTPDLTAA